MQMDLEGQLSKPQESEEAVKLLVRKESNDHRRDVIGGSDARVIMGQDEKALIRLWQEKRGEVGPEDLSTNLIVQLGLVTEALNRQWYERNTGSAITDGHPRWHRRGQWSGLRLLVASLAEPDAGATSVLIDRAGSGHGRSQAGLAGAACENVEFYLRRENRALRNRTPAPPPFSSINSIPAASRASCSFARASSDTCGPNPPSIRLTVGRESPARDASSV
jgi:hypothetical protein